jgi:Tol biopolymer transport system component
MLTKSGVKLLDYGLAMRTMPAAGIAFDDATHDAFQGLTAEGTILGTLQYISPEQLEGKQADVRTDIFAFGTLAYEMITGRKAFPSTNQAQLISAILKDDPQPIVELVPGVPVPLVQTLSRCLAKDPDERWQTASDLLFQLRSIVSSPAALDARESPARRFPHRIERAAWTAVVVVSIVGAFLWGRSRDDRPLDSAQGRTAIRYKLFPAEGTAFYSGSELPFALSPDGRQIVYVGVKADGTKQLWLHSLYSELEQPIAGTEGAYSPFWSTDSQWIGLFSGNTLKKVRISTGLTQIVASGVVTRGGAAWSADDVIVFPAGAGGLSRVSAQGGPVSMVTTTAEGNHFWPQFLGDGKHFIYSAAIPGSIYIGSLGNEAPRILMKFPVRISSLGYVPGYVFFVQDATLFARPFDEKRLEFSGEPVRIADGIPIMGKGRAAFSVSAAGVLAYWPYPFGMPAVLHWFERDGRVSAAVDTPSQYFGFALSPDAHKLAFSRTARSGGADLWLRDLTDGSESRLTFDGAAFTPQWSPEGERIVFSGPGEHPPPKLFIKNVADTGAASLVGVSKGPDFAASWSGDGRSIVSVRLDSKNHTDLWVVRLEDAVAERLPFNTPFNENQGKISPDSRWIVYTTDESGKEEVWVASFPSGKIRRQVSAGGGTSPQWGEGSGEVLYLSDDKRLMAARVSAGQTDLDISSPRVLFQIRNLVELDRSVFPTSNTYVSAANGRRFLMAVSARDPDAPPITVVVNWTALLHR